MAKNTQRLVSGDNRLLAALPISEYEHLLPHFQSVTLELKKVIGEPGEPIVYAYFPKTGMPSLMIIGDNDSAVEVNTVGNEGMVGVSLLLGAVNHYTKVMSQVAGDAMRMRAETFKREVKPDSVLYGLLQRYAHATMNQLAQSAACNQMHSIEERMCRWLLTTHDRVEDDVFPLTQEFLSYMLGVRRPTVTVTAGAFQQAGYIRYRHGKVTILDRDRLEECTCDCYKLIRNEIDSLFS